MLLQNIITVAYWYWVDNPKLFCQSCDNGMVQNVLVCCRFPFSGTAKPKKTASKTFPHHNHLCTKLQLTQCSQASAVVLETARQDTLKRLIRWTVRQLGMICTLPGLSGEWVCLAIGNPFYDALYTLFLRWSAGDLNAGGLQWTLQKVGNLQTMSLSNLWHCFAIVPSYGQFPSLTLLQYP